MTTFEKVARERHAWGGDVNARQIFGASSRLSLPARTPRLAFGLLQSRTLIVIDSVFLLPPGFLNAGSFRSNVRSFQTGANEPSVISQERDGPLRWKWNLCPGPPRPCNEQSSMLIDHTCIENKTRNIISHDKTPQVSLFYVQFSISMFFVHCVCFFTANLT